MKKILYLTLALVLLVACSQDSFEKSNSKSIEGNLSFEIKDKGFVSMDTPITRTTTDSKFITHFKDGDEAGLYIVRDGKVIATNIKLQASEVGRTDSIAWYSEIPVSYNPKDSYYIYTPYLSSPPEAPGIGEIFIPNSEENKDSLFFANMINAWNVENDHYEDNDLMTGTGIVNGKTSSQAYKLSCTMTHRMAAILLQFPSTIYKFTDSSIPDYKSDTVYVEDNSQSFRSSPIPGSGLFYLQIIKPSNETRIQGMYRPYNMSTSLLLNYNFTTSSIAGGTYKTYKIDNAAPNVYHYTLQAGDYLCTTKDKSDWFIKPRELARSEYYLQHDRDSCIGIVSYVGDAPITDNYGLLKSEQFRGGKIHGIVVAIRQGNNYTMGKSIWSSYSGQTNISEAWLKNSTWTGKIKRPDNFISLEPRDKYQGYANTVALEEYNKQYQPVKGSKYINALDSLEKFRTLFHYKVPSNTSGWYIPSWAELSEIVKLIKPLRYGDSVWTSTEFIDRFLYWTQDQDTKLLSYIWPVLVF